jgi:hypothetical protein
MYSYFRLQHCPFDLELRKCALDFVVVIFFKNAKKTTSGGLFCFVLFLTEEAYSHGGLRTRELGQTPSC